MKKVGKNILKRIYYNISDIFKLTHKVDKRIYTESPYPMELSDFYNDLYNNENIEKYEYLIRNKIF